MIHDLLLFDLDGTISDPIEGIARSINHSLSHFGYPELPHADISPFIGPPLDETFRAITGSSAESHIGELVGRYRERYADVGYSENTLYPGIVEAIEALAATGIPMGICTSKRSDFAERILGMFGILEHFSFIDGGEIGVRKTEQIARLIEQGRAGTSSIMIGDRSVDMIAAHSNGLAAAGVLWGYGSREELSGENPLHLFEAPKNLVSLCPGG